MNNLNLILEKLKEKIGFKLKNKEIIREIFSRELKHAFSIEKFNFLDNKIIFYCPVYLSKEFFLVKNKLLFLLKKEGFDIKDILIKLD